ncbi:hypothetical protein [Myxococcus landrumensis]|uniref:hypothetical protein n=1 Tax=Myxococcus landrumensis TaxID=2813577 RepID=UPI001F507B25|nr:hypothetical protein [Myxococcus landrumus]
MGFFTALESGLDEAGRGDVSKVEGWPARANVDVYLNSGVLPTRPFQYTRTPLLQVNSFGVDISPITRATTSWMTPVALSRFIHLRYERFASSEMDDTLIARIKQELVPRECPAQQGASCVFQDPLKHGQVEAVRLGYRQREFVAP